MLMNANLKESPQTFDRASATLKGKVAIVTGAARGLGKAIATALAAEGVAVMVNDIDAECGKAAAQGILDRGGMASFQQGDVSKAEDTQRLVAATIERFTRLDILVNNAGLQYISPIEEFPVEKWNYLIGVLLTGPFLMTKYSLPHMRRQGRGRIINISSTQGLVATEFKSAYVAAKHGVLGLTKATALEGAPHNVTAVAVCPCFIRTELAEKQVAGQAKFHGISEEEVVAKLLVGPAALKRMLEPEEVAALVVYLSTDAAQGITGSAIPIDCGWTAR
jgi:3-hydroxybutyrate dehydrogenase